MPLGCMRSQKYFSVIDSKLTFGDNFLVLHCNYNGEIGQKFHLVVTFDVGSLRSKVSASELYFAKSFQGHPT